MAICTVFLLSGDIISLSCLVRDLMPSSLIMSYLFWFSFPFSSVRNIFLFAWTSNWPIKVGGYSLIFKVSSSSPAWNDDPKESPIFFFRSLSYFCFILNNFGFLLAKRLTPSSPSPDVGYAFLNLLSLKTNSLDRRKIASRLRVAAYFCICWLS